jgi:penicillin amidase
MLWRRLGAAFFGAVVAAGCISVGTWLLLQRSLPPSFQSIAAPVRDSVRIWRDSFAIPTIVASRSTDAFFALGYLHAEDRLWQMDLLRRIASGRLAEIVGEEAFPLDYLMRTLGLALMAQRLWDSLHPLSRQILQRYSEGVNAWLRHNASRLPPEFLLLGYTPEPWTPLHSLAIARLMAFDLAFCFWSDIAMGTLAEELGSERAWDLLPSYPAAAPTIADEAPLSPPLPTEGTARRFPLPPPPPHGFSELASLRQMLAPWLVPTPAAGSNAWAVRTREGAVLANDPHLVLGLPARWYPVCILSPDYEVAGVTLPGLPLVVIGRNRSIAWGVTNLMADESDFFIELADTANPYRYWDGNRWQSFQRQRDTIRIRGRAPVVVELLRSRNGPIISAAHLFSAPKLLFRGRSDTTTNPFLQRYRLSYRWAAENISDEVIAAYRIGRARSWENFRAALRTWGAPVLCFVYADVAGVIAAQPAGFIPVRDSTLPEQTWAFPLPGWEARYAWRGVTSALSLPNMVTPRQGFVVSANNKLAHRLPLPLSYIWEPPSRAQRLTELLQQRGAAYALTDAARMQVDVLSPYAREMLRYLLPFLATAQLSLPAAQRARHALQAWDYQFAPTSIGATVFAVFLERMLTNTFGAHLPEARLREYFFLSNLALRRLMELVQDPSSPWFDNPRTPQRETLAEVVQQSFAETVDTLSRRFGPDVSRWTYGRLHTLWLEHPLGLNPLLRPLFSRGPYPSAGAPTTVNTGEWHLWAPFRHALGASVRFLAELRRDTTLWAVVLPGGVSGHFLSSHYTDQLLLWLHGGIIRRELRVPAGARVSVVLYPASEVTSPSRSERSL